MSCTKLIKIANINAITSLQFVTSGKSRKAEQRKETGWHACKQKNVWSSSPARLILDTSFVFIVVLCPERRPTCCDTWNRDLALVMVMCLDLPRRQAYLIYKGCVGQSRRALFRHTKLGERTASTPRRARQTRQPPDRATKLRNTTGSIARVKFNNLTQPNDAQLAD